MVMKDSGECIPIEKVQVGDYLMGDDSTPRRVLETTRGRGMLYEISIKGGDPSYVNINHVLSLKVSNHNGVWLKRYSGSPDQTWFPCDAHEWLKQQGKHCGGDVVDIPLKDYLKIPKHIRSALKWHRVGVDFPERNVPIDPYMVGLWLGGGTLAGYMETSARSHVGVQHGQFLKDYGLFDNKHIPDLYLFNSREVRLKLLAGLVDSDGYMGNNCCFLTLSNRYPSLIKGCIKLIRSLGFASYPKKVKTHTNGPKKCECTTFQCVGQGLEEVPCILERKIIGKRISLKSTLVTEITSVKEWKVDDYFGFELDGNGRYLHEDFSVTHNSTIISCLSRGIADDGNGSARKLIRVHRHEEKQTSSVGLFPMGFDEEGKLVSVDDHKTVRKDVWQHVAKHSAKKITFIDLCGHERYLKTTCHGLTGYYPHYGMVLVEGNKARGLAEATGGTASKNMTKQHLGIVISLNIPFFFVVTKVDIADEEILERNIESIKAALRRVKMDQVEVVEDESGVANALVNVNNPRYLPIFKVSSVTNEGFDLFKKFLYLLPKPEERKGSTLVDTETEEEKESKKEEVPGIEKGCVGIDSIYNVPGVGTVVAGTVRGGIIVKGSNMLLGPRDIVSSGEGKGGGGGGDEDAFEPVYVRSIETHYIDRDMVAQGDIAAFAIRVKKGKKLKVEKGMYLVHPAMKPRTIHMAKVFIKILHHQTTIRNGYSPHLHCGPTAISVRFVRMEKADKNGVGTGKPCEFIRTGSNAIVTVRFLRGVYLFPGDQILMREGDAKGCGWVKEIYYERNTSLIE